MSAPRSISFVAGLALISAPLFAAAPVTVPGAEVAPIGLLRLRDPAPRGLAEAKFSVDELAAQGGQGAKKTRNGIDTLELSAAEEWSRPLRGGSKKVQFVSFQLFASQSTVIRVGGARLGVTTSFVPDRLQLMHDEPAAGMLQWTTLDVHSAVESYDGQALAPLPVLTVRLDPANNSWDLFANARLLAHSLPLAATGNGAEQFLVKAGTSGAWLSGLVMSDEHPLYVDANDNGVDDEFERRARFGELLPVNASATERGQLALAWRAFQRSQAPAILFFNRPRPDRLR